MWDSAGGFGVHMGHYQGIWIWEIWLTFSGEANGDIRMILQNFELVIPGMKMTILASAKITRVRLPTNALFHRNVLYFIWAIF
jgi:hypothetical protein